MYICAPIDTEAVLPVALSSSRVVHNAIGLLQTYVCTVLTIFEDTIVVLDSTASGHFLYGPRSALSSTWI